MGARRERERARERAVLRRRVCSPSAAPRAPGAAHEPAVLDLYWTDLRSGYRIYINTQTTPPLTLHITHTDRKTTERKPKSAPTITLTGTPAPHGRRRHRADPARRNSAEHAHMRVDTLSSRRAPTSIVVPACIQATEVTSLNRTGSQQQGAQMKSRDEVKSRSVVVTGTQTCEKMCLQYENRLPNED